MRLAICHGEGENFLILSEEGLRRPITIVTMDHLWWEAAAEYKVPRMFFNDKLRMMRFCLGHELVVVTTRDGSEETGAMAASFVAMGAVDLVIHCD